MRKIAKNAPSGSARRYSKLEQQGYFTPLPTASLIDSNSRKMYIMGGGPIMEKEYIKTLLELLKQTPKNKKEAITQLKQIGVLNRKGKLAKSH